MSENKDWKWEEVNEALSGWTYRSGINDSYKYDSYERFEKNDMRISVEEAYKLIQFGKDRVLEMVEPEDGLRPYIVVGRGFNEPDNNTPSEEVWLKVIRIKPNEISKYKKIIVNEFNTDYPNGVIVEFYPLDGFENDWGKVGDIW